MIPKIKLARINILIEVLERRMQEVLHHPYQDLGNIGCNEHLLFYDLAVRFADAGRYISFLDAVVNFGEDALKLHYHDRGLFKQDLQIPGGMVRMGRVVGSIADTAKAAAVVS